MKSHARNGNKNLQQFMLSNSDKFKDDSYMQGMGMMAFSSQEVSSSKDVSMGDGEDYSRTH